MTTVIPHVHYRTTDGQDDYVFTFRHNGAGWRIDIVSQPGYNGRSDGSLATHRLHDATGWYICWDRPIPTLDAAKGIAALWADATQNYRRTGRFGASGSREHVQDHSTTALVPWAGTAGDPSQPGRPSRAFAAHPSRTTGILSRLTDWIPRR